MKKKTIAFDFDGVIHRYSKGWQDGDIYDEPVEGIGIVIDQLRLAGYQVVIYSTRCATEEGIVAMTDWLNEYNIKVDGFYTEKPPAIIYVDDRAINFNGNCEKLIKDIQNFKPWTERAFKVCPYCGKEFTKDLIRSSNRKKYCSDECRIKMSIKFNNERLKRRRKNK